MSYDTGGMPDDWVPPDPPPIGSKRWLDDMAFKFMVEKFNGLPDKSGIFELPRVMIAGTTYELGYFALFKDDYGSNYFRVEEIETLKVIPRFTND